MAWYRKNRGSKTPNSVVVSARADFGGSYRCGCIRNAHERHSVPYFDDTADDRAGQHAPPPLQIFL